NGDKKWEKEYDFDDVYRLKKNDPNLANEMSQLQYEGELAEKYKTYYSVKSNSQPITRYNSWLNYWCAISNFTKSTYQKCINRR
ncbi:MAG TPA: hypothetical protein VHA13_04515, partial [Gammaproteobacteria bacterium]|nr:hypothetical protein [Gammaproteobacteria bacterium]